MEKSKRKVSAAFSMAIFLRGRKFSEGGKFPLLNESLFCFVFVGNDVNLAADMIEKSILLRMRLFNETCKNAVRSREEAWC